MSTLADRPTSTKRKKTVVSGLLLAVGLMACEKKAKQPVEDLNVPITIGPSLPLALPGLEGRTIQTVCLNVNKFETPQKSVPMETPERMVAQALGFAGVTVLSERASCDARLDITLVSKASGALYTDRRTHFTGASAEGTMTLSMAGDQPRLVQLESHVHLEERISAADSRLAPEEAKTEGVVRAALLKGLVRIWGAGLLIRLVQHGPPHHAELRLRMVTFDITEVFDSLEPQVKGEALPKLISLLGEKDVDRFHVNWFLIKIGKPAVPALVAVLKGQNAEAVDDAITALRWIGPDATEAVPALIGTLRSDKQQLRERAASTLFDICYKANNGPELSALGQDADRWQQWWERQR